MCLSALANQRAPANGQKYLCNVDKALKNSLSIGKGFYDVWTDPTAHISPTKKMWRQSILNTDCSGHQWTQSSKCFALGHRYGWTALCSKVDNARRAHYNAHHASRSGRLPPSPPKQSLTSESTRHWYKIKSASTASHLNAEILKKKKKTIQFKQKPPFGHPWKQVAANGNTALLLNGFLSQLC